MLGYLLAIGCGFLWGVSTPLMKYYSPKHHQDSENNQTNIPEKSSTEHFSSSSSRRKCTKSQLKQQQQEQKDLSCQQPAYDHKALANRSPTQTGLISNSFTFLVSLTSNWKFVISFLLNQLGSVLYTISLHYNPITISVPIANSISLALIVFSDCFTQKIRITPRLLAGLFFVSLGVVLCLLSSST